jgi:hypothetical protein
MHTVWNPPEQLQIDICHQNYKFSIPCFGVAVQKMQFQSRPEIFEFRPPELAMTCNQSYLFDLAITG